MAKTTVELPDALHRTLRVKAALEDRSMNAIIVAAMQGYLHSFRLEPGLLDANPGSRDPHPQRGPSKER